MNRPASLRDGRVRIPRVHRRTHPGLLIAVVIIVAMLVALWALVLWLRGEPRPAARAPRTSAANQLIFDRDRALPFNLTVDAKQLGTIDRDVRHAVAVQPATPELLKLAGSNWVTHEIRYELPEAADVYLRWGINGWKVVPEAVWPPETTRNEMLSTRMHETNGVFTAVVKVPAGALINYGFWIGKSRDGRDIGVWDGNGYPSWGYQAVAKSGGITVISGMASLLDSTKPRPNR